MDKVVDPEANEANWRDLRSALGVLRDGQRTVVPVLGAGVRSWLGLPRPFTSWLALLQRIARQLEVPTPELERAPGHKLIYQPWLIGEYEALVHAYRERHYASEAPHIAENALIRNVVHPMLDVRRLQRHKLRTENRAALLDLRFADWIDLSIDNAFAPTIPPQEVVDGRIGRSPRTVQVPLGSGTRAWHPHGFLTGKHAETTTILGVQRYARAVGGVVQAFEAVKAFHRRCNDAEKRLDLRILPGAPNSHWVHVALNAPLLLIGVGVSSEEWDLWTFLELRARAHARMGPEQRPPVFRLTCDSQEEVRSRVQIATAGRVVPIRHVHGGDTWDDAWQKLFRHTTSIDTLFHWRSTT
jgi:hypothetical protein